MAGYIIEINSKVKKQLALIYRSGDKAGIKKINQIFEELQNHPKTGLGQPEQLKNNFSGYWSRRINKKDRLVYAIKEEVVTVKVISALGHYDDK